MAHESSLIDDLMSVIDRHAGREHSRTGSVAAALREVLERYDTNSAEDRLGWMLRRQREFQEDILGHGSLNDLTPNQRADYFRVQSLGLVFELGEASNEIGWKPWATSQHFNPEAYLSEAIDVIHFAINLALAGGATNEQIFQMFVAKNEKNRARQVEGYDGVTGKCPGCRRSYDDAGVSCMPPTPEAPVYWCSMESGAV